MNPSVLSRWLVLVCACALLALPISAQEETPRLIIDPKGPSGKVFELLFTPDGSTLISAGTDKAIRFWDVSSGDLRKTIRLNIGDGGEGLINNLALSHDGRWLAVGGWASSYNSRYGDIRILDLENGRVAAVLTGHTSTVPVLSFSEDARLLASGSTDNEVRIWNMEDLANSTSTTESALLIETSEVLTGHQSQIRSLSFSPKAERLVSGAYGGSLILWKREPTGTYTKAATMEGHARGVMCAEFSPDGKHIVSGGMEGSIQVWNGESGTKVRELVADMQNSVATVRFSPDGTKVLASSRTRGIGKTAIFNFATGKQLTTFDRHTETVMTGVWHPDKELVSSTGGDNSDIYLWAPSTGEMLQHIVGEGRTCTSAAFSKQGAKVAFGQTLRDDVVAAETQLEKTFDFSTFTLNEISAEPTGFHRAVHTRGGHTLSRSDDFLRLETSSGEIVTNMSELGRILCYTYLPDGSIAIGCDYALIIYSPSGEILCHFVGHEGAIWSVVPSSDGRYLISTSVDQTVRLWSLENLSKDSRGAVGAGLTDTPGGVAITKVNEGFPAEAAGLLAGDQVVSVDGKAFTSYVDLIEYSKTIPPGGQITYRVRRDGKEMDFPMVMKELTFPRKVEPLASLFVSSEKEWVCWTPSGYYHASPGGERFIGWHINKGIDKIAEYYPSYVFRDQFHRPELVKRTILLQSQKRALAELGETAPTDLTGSFPPRVDWILPAATRSINSAAEVTVQASISSPNAELEEVKLLLNGKAVESDFRISGNEHTFEKTLTLQPGENRLSIFARNRAAGHTSDERILTVRSATAPATVATAPTPISADDLDDILKPDLYVLAVGVSEYEDETIPGLTYCDDDAEAVADFFEKQGGALFGKTEVKLLTNDLATEGDVQDGLDWLEENATQKDFVVLFLAAHGVNDDKGDFYLLPHDANPERLRSSGVAWDDFGKILGNLPSRVLMFLDTCHSGQLGKNLFTMANVDGAKSRSVGGLRSAFDPTEAIRELTSDENGVVIMAASTGDEESLEHDDWGHGAFTLGLLDGLGGKADVNADGIIHLRELDFFLSDRVKELTGGRQHPTTVKPSTISRLPVAAVK